MIWFIAYVIAGVIYATTRLVRDREVVYETVAKYGVSTTAGALAIALSVLIAAIFWPFFAVRRALRK